MKTKKLLIACTFLFFFFFIHQSCTKIDTKESFSHNTTDEITQKFFQLPANANPAILRVAAEMKKCNDAKEFVTAFVKNNGYPVWDKAIIKKEKPAVANRSNNSFEDEADTLVILPVAAADTAYVTGFVNARLNGDVSLNLYRGGDYAMYGFNDVPEDSVNADKAVLQIMQLNKKVFGYTRFKINDNRLFAKRLPPGSDTISGKAAEISDVPDNGLLTYELCTNVCIHRPCSICHQLDCSLNLDSYICFLECTTYTVGGGGSGGGGGTGGGGSSPNPGFPCASSQGKGIAAANPCGGPVVVPPVIPIPPVPLMKTPCQKVQELFQIPNIKSSYQTIQNYAGGPQEMAAAFNTQGQVVFTPGIEHKVPNMKLPSTNCIGYVHCHDAGGDYYLFSLADLEDIYTHHKEDLINLATVTIGVIAPDGTPYFLTIQNPDDFVQKFGENFIEAKNDKQRDDTNWAYFKKNMSPADSERGLLQFAKNIGMGVSLVKSNNDFTVFTELTLNSNGTAVVRVPCN